MISIVNIGVQNFFEYSIIIGYDWYFNQFPKTFKRVGEKKILLEKSPNYFKGSEFIPKKILDTNSKTEILLIIRDPFIRMVSHFLHFKANSQIEKKKGNNCIELQCLLILIINEIT